MSDATKELRISTRARDEFLDITAQVREAVSESGVIEGVCHVYVPHTTAGVTINEGADPAVKRDIIAELDRLVPHDGRFAHAEGNSAAHVKTTIVGSSQTIPVSGGKLLLGTWQSIYFCEFDGPRSRKTYVQLIPA
jgi:secondary thiamine-phosphate synthase enzyme